MEKYVCQVCDYIYDPDKGDTTQKIAPGTAFEDLPDDWLCPECSEGPVSTGHDHAETEMGLSFPEYVTHAISFFALFGHGDTFVRHDVSLQFSIKDCLLLGRFDFTMTSPGMTICVVNSHIISSAVHPKYV